jgi:hypothetical protein
MNIDDSIYTNKSIYRNGINIYNDTDSTRRYSDSPIRLFISPNTDYSDLQIYDEAFTDNKISSLYNSYNSNIYSINFSESNSNVIINGNSNIPLTLLGNYLISTSYNKSSILPTTQDQIIPLEETPITTITIKYPTQTYIRTVPIIYKKDGFLKYVAGSINSVTERNTGKWEIINYDTIGLANSNHAIVLYYRMGDYVYSNLLDIDNDRKLDNRTTNILVKSTSNQ